VKLGRMAHGCIGAAIVFGGRQGIPEVPLGAWFFTATVVGCLWEIWFQKKIARLFGWRDVRPNGWDLAAFMLGAAAAIWVVDILSMPVPL
jgi:hypothetical protein